jgi:hypothetical protein
VVLVDIRFEFLAIDVWNWFSFPSSAGSSFGSAFLWNEFVIVS